MLPIQLRQWLHQLVRCSIAAQGLSLGHARAGAQTVGTQRVHLSRATHWAAACWAHAQGQLTSQKLSHSTHSFSSFHAALLLPFALLPVLAHADSKQEHDSALVEAGEEQGPTWSLIGLEQKRRIFFKYEKRIRDKSSLEKVFDYFSSKQAEDGVKYMTPLDLLTAIVPTYPPSKSQQERSGSLDGEPAPRSPAHTQQLQRASEGVFKQFDVDGDGRLSFWEYRLVLALLAIPEADAAIIFNAVDLDGSGSIDAAEFQEVIALLQGSTSSRKVAKSRVGRGLFRKPHAVSGLLVSFFGPDQKGKLGLKQFITFLHQLHTEVTELEFMHYDVDNSGTIPGLDFARSLIAAADVRTVDSLMDKVDALPAALQRVAVTKKDFCAMVGLARKSHSLEVALSFYDQVGRPVAKQDLDRLLRKLCGCTLSPQVLDIVMALFGDARGNLDVHTFVHMLQCRAHLWSSRSHPETPSEGLTRLWGCFKQCVTSDE